MSVWRRVIDDEDDCTIVELHRDARRGVVYFLGAGASRGNGRSRYLGEYTLAVFF